MKIPFFKNKISDIAPVNSGHDARGIANIFVRLMREKNDRITIMHLLRYVYFAQGWTLGHTGKPLFHQEMYAWRFGPVVPEVRHSYGGSGYLVPGESWDKNKQPYTANVSKEEREIIVSVFNDHRHLDLINLRRIAMRPNAPWNKYRGCLYEVIPKSEIESYYRGLAEKMKARELGRAA